jgi:hypothetical protein
LEKKEKADRNMLGSKKPKPMKAKEVAAFE